MGKRKLYYSVFAVILTILVVAIMLSLRVDVENPGVYDGVDGKDDYAMKVYHADEGQNQANDLIGKDDIEQGPTWIKRTILDIPSTK
ncbi:hypothetical protein [Caloranaerobacter ferrireducens]|uniref:hypothetical protein n=1 Tax=Caloranaerobacter ferrireducens TaxID=1323370 RepID=UPI00084DAC53|nr:hypothetical protein [Caloranaerobacter ferrireducens]